MIDIDDRGGVSVLTLAHGKANALDVELCDAIAARIEDCRASSSCTAVVVTARGGIFSAGVDLVRLVGEGAPYVERFLPALRRVFDALFAFPKPLVAAVNGHAIAGGCIVACAADRRLMARGSGRIGVPELLVGVAFPMVALEIVRLVVAPERVSALVYGGATLTAEEALTQGLIDAVVDSDRLLDEAITAAQMFASRPPDVFALTKRQLRASAQARIAAGGQFDAEVDAIWTSPATLDGIRSYIDRTFKKA